MIKKASTPPASAAEAWETVAEAAARRPEIRPTPELRQRFEQIYARLAALPRAQRRRLQRGLKLGLAGVALLLASGLAPATALAATITVNGNGASGTCSLAAAITNANNDNQSGSANCAAGGGADTINLAVNVGLTTALPTLDSAITIEGNGHTVSRTSGDLRILTVGTAGIVTIKRITISGGSLGAGNGAGIYNAGSLMVQNSTISGNSCYAGTVTVQNSTISGTTASSGGGIFSQNMLTLQNSTISGNSGYSGGGIYNDYGTVWVQNSIIARQAAGSYDCAGAIMQIVSEGYNIESETSCNFSESSDHQGVADIDLKLLALADNGGPTWTHALDTASVAIDKISIGTNGCVAGTSTDQRGADRAGGPGSGGSACDIGAYEYDSGLPTAIALRELGARSASPGGGLAALGGVLMAFGALLRLTAWRRRTLPSDGGPPPDRPYDDLIA